MQYYLLRQRFVQLAKDNEYIQSYKEEAIRRTPLFCIRSIRNLLMAGEYRTAKRYLRLAEAIDLEIAESEYYRIVEEIITSEKIENIDVYKKAEGKYLDSLKSEKSRGVTNTAPYTLPDGAELIQC